MYAAAPFFLRHAADLSSPFLPASSFLLFFFFSEQKQFNFSSPLLQQPALILFPFFFCQEITNAASQIQLAPLQQLSLFFSSNLPISYCPHLPLIPGRAQQQDLPLLVVAEASRDCRGSALSFFFFFFSFPFHCFPMLTVGCRPPWVQGAFLLVIEGIKIKAIVGTCRTSLALWYPKS